MKIRIGGGPLSDQQATQLRLSKVPTSTDLAKIENAIRDSLLASIKEEVLAISPQRLQKMADAVRMAATLEALKLFGEIGSLIDSQARGIQGIVRWKPLSYQYEIWKGSYLRGRAKRGRGRHADVARASAAANSFFALSGRLNAYFKKNGHSIVLNRFGGVRVEADVSRLPKRRLTLIDATAEVQGRSFKFNLGRISVHMFPSISPHLMPMLASGRWSDTSEKASFERAMLPKGVADKLSGGKRGTYRPLVLPMTQFFILKRIPAAIQVAVSKQIKGLRI